MIIQTSGDEQDIRLPQFIGAKKLPELFHVCQQVRQSDGDIVLNGQDVQFIDPLGIAVLGALLEPIRAERRCRIEWLNVNVGTYIDRMDLISRCEIEGVISNCGVRHDRKDRLAELRCVRNAHEVDQAADSLATAIAGKLTPANPDESIDMETGRNKFDDFRYPLAYVLRELLLNSLTHARKEGRGDAAVWVAAQHYTPESEVQLAVVDNGCGILSTLQNSPAVKSKTHADAIHAALEPFVTCNPDIGLPGGTANQGVGLTTTRRIANAARGTLLIATGDTATRALSAHHLTDIGLGPTGFWPGVAIQATFRRSDLPAINIPSLLPKIASDSDIELRFTQ